MNKTIAIIFVSLIMFVAGVAVGLLIPYDFNTKEQNSATAEKQAKIEEMKRVQADLKKAYDDQFPDIFKGEMRIVSNTESYVKNEHGKEYLIDPARPISFYKDSKVESGSKVLFQGKIIDENRISLGNIRSINAQ